MELSIDKRLFKMVKEKSLVYLKKYYVNKWMKLDKIRYTVSEISQNTQTILYYIICRNLLKQFIYNWRYSFN